MNASKGLQKGGARGDWGRLLLGFLECFGGGFDYDEQAVAITRGGIVPKSVIPLASVRDSTRLCVEDALTGRCAPHHRYWLQYQALVTMLSLLREHEWAHPHQRLCSFE